ncbi:GNAT family N-acetyltransferase [Lapidilactobacillus gannanensis]|jgi:GNAT superfamily N-acetyltransferase|uniref:GNAT family N-acetyltransferase n=1 Tax=Lapidilactobacillus gannanensis TaxID=2486002 RepID=A0ABW4BMP8_9LACO|nr:GNAT family N-acetyltransferase [Lapidilactobacillus gannanensis]MCH4058244.1 GNAT family N-acetyltransferase [Lactobacillaceae bacterium]
MALNIQRLKRKDFENARKFAIEGMNLQLFTNNLFELYFYSKYFVFSELSQATHAYGAYWHGELAGVLLVNMKGQPKIFNFPIRARIVKMVMWLITHFYGELSDDYDQANAEMMDQYRLEHRPAGELSFFAVDPTILGQGIGTKLLKRLAKDEAGKLVYLYTDSGCTYPFYFHRGFKKKGQQEIELPTGADEPQPLTCFLLDKQL